MFAPRLLIFLVAAAPLVCGGRSAADDSSIIYHPKTKGFAGDLLNGLARMWHAGMQVIKKVVTTAANVVVNTTKSIVNGLGHLIKGGLGIVEEIVPESSGFFGNLEKFIGSLFRGAENFGRRLVAVGVSIGEEVEQGIETIGLDIEQDLISVEKTIANVLTLGIKMVENEAIALAKYVTNVIRWVGKVLTFIWHQIKTIVQTAWSDTIEVESVANEVANIILNASRKLANEIRSIFNGIRSIPGLPSVIQFINSISRLAGSFISDLIFVIFPSWFTTFADELIETTVNAVECSMEYSPQELDVLNAAVGWSINAFHDLFLNLQNLSKPSDATVAFFVHTLKTLAQEGLTAAKLAWNTINAYATCTGITSYENLMPRLVQI